MAEVQDSGVCVWGSGEEIVYVVVTEEGLEMVRREAGKKGESEPFMPN